jgi:hypothetical protein
MPRAPNLFARRFFDWMRGVSLLEKKENEKFWRMERLGIPINLVAPII